MEFRLIVSDKATGMQWIFPCMPAELRQLVPLHTRTDENGRKVYKYYNFSHVFIDDNERIVTGPELLAHYEENEKELKGEGIENFSDYLTSCLLQSGGCLTPIHSWIDGLEEKYMEEYETEEKYTLDFSDYMHLLTADIKGNDFESVIHKSINKEWACFFASLYNVTPDKEKARMHYYCICELVGVLSGSGLISLETDETVITQLERVFNETFS